MRRQRVRAAQRALSQYRDQLEKMRKYQLHHQYSTEERARFELTTVSAGLKELMGIIESRTVIKSYIIIELAKQDN